MKALYKMNEARSLLLEEQVKKCDALRRTMEPDPEPRGGERGRCRRAKPSDMNAHLWPSVSPFNPRFPVAVLGLLRTWFSCALIHRTCRYGVHYEQGGPISNPRMSHP